MRYPKQIYVILPFSDNGKAESIYVGSTKNLDVRLKEHLDVKNQCKTQVEMHRLMRENGFAFGVVGEIRNYAESHLEYDWIDFFEKNYSELKILNKFTMKKPNWHRLDYPQGQLNQFNIKSWDKVYHLFKIIK